MTNSSFAESHSSNTRENTPCDKLSTSGHTLTEKCATLLCLHKIFWRKEPRALWFTCTRHLSNHILQAVRETVYTRNALRQTNAANCGQCKNQFYILEQRPTNALQSIISFHVRKPLSAVFTFKMITNNPRLCFLCQLRVAMGDKTLTVALQRVLLTISFLFMWGGGEWGLSFYTQPVQTLHFRLHYEDNIK